MSEPDAAALLASPYCTSTALVAPLGRTRCDKPAGHDGWHRWQIEWDDTQGPVQADLTRPAKTSEAVGGARNE